MVARVLHGAITVVFLAAIGAVWAAALTGDTNWITVFAAALVVAEGVLLLAAHGHCPLAPAWRRLGDETPFFDVLLGRALGRRAIPVFAAIVIAAFVLLGARLLLADLR